MLSKLLQAGCRLRPMLLPLSRMEPLKVAVRRSGDYIPPSQYDTPPSRKFRLTYVLRVYWELIPIFVTTCISISILMFSIVWATKNKVDVVFSTHSRDNISRTMDLRNPTAHKLLLIHQRYEPWPEMQDVLDKMVFAHRRALARTKACEHP